MNWPQIGSQIVSTLIVAVVAAGPLGLIAKFYLGRSRKTLGASDAERLEKLEAELNQRRDSRRALIGQSNYAAEKAVAIEFEAIQDMNAGLAWLRTAMDNCRHFTGRVPADETPEQRGERLSGAVRELVDARNEMLILVENRRLFLPPRGRIRLSPAMPETRRTSRALRTRCRS